MISDFFRIVTILIGTLGAGWFLLPVFTGRIVNIGNVTGFAVSACLFFYGLKQGQIRHLLQTAWKSGTILRGALCGGGILLASAALTVLVLTGMMIHAAREEPDPEASVVVLGCEVKGDRPSLMLVSRMDTAVRYLREHPDVCCVVSGGRGEHEQISEAECMYRYMTAQGIAPERIIREDRSTSTRENLLFSAAILRERDAGDRIAVVTNEFHVCRARLIAADLGLRQRQNGKWFVFTPHARARLDPCAMLLSGPDRDARDAALFEEKWGKNVYDPCYSPRFSRKKANYHY